MNMHTAAPLIAGLSAGLLTYFLMYLYNRRKKWILVGKVSKLFIYPIKSAMGSEVDCADCSKIGLQAGQLMDRRFMIVLTSDVKKFITGREEPQLVLFKPTVSDDKVLTITNPIGSSVQVDLNEVERGQQHVESRLFNDVRVDGLDCGDVVSQWLSDSLDKPSLYYRLLYMPPNDASLTPRYVNRHPKWGKLAKNDDISQFSDLSPYMLLTQGSVDDLYSKTAPEYYDVRRFRPNILVEGAAAPFEEDKWTNVRIGDVIMRRITHCDRCVMTTIDPDTGVKHENSEPLRTLRTRTSAGDRHLSVGRHKPHIQSAKS